MMNVVYLPMQKMFDQNCSISMFRSFGGDLPQKRNELWNMLDDVEHVESIPNYFGY